MIKTDKNFYDLSLSQDVNILQCKFTFYKQVMNILASLEFKKDVDVELLEKAWNLVVERNDCLRIQFFKKKGTHYQYFRDQVEYINIPRYEFNDEQFNEWYLEYRKHCVKYLKGICAEPQIIKMNRKIVFFVKFCHLAVDMYGISKIFEDFVGCYKALKEGTELPKQLGSFEELIAQDVKDKFDAEKQKKQEDFFREYLRNKPEPYFASAAGFNDPIWNKRYAKGKHTVFMDLIKCTTEPYEFVINKKTADKVMKFAEKSKITPSTILFYIYNLTFSKINNNVPHMFPLFLSNCRGTLKQKNCAGTKVQSMGFYTSLDYEKSFNDDLVAYNEIQQGLLHHIGVSDMKMQTWMHQEWPSSALETYYSICYSFIPVKEFDDVQFRMYSNGKGSLMCYLAQLYNVDTGEIEVCYDVNVDHCDKENITKMHAEYVKMINDCLDHPNKLIKDFEL